MNKSINWVYQFKTESSWSKCNWFYLIVCDIAKHPLENCCIDDILRDSGILGILSNIFRDMGIQGFLNFGDICHIYFRDMGYFPKYLKGYGILGPPFQGFIIYTHAGRRVAKASVDVASHSF